MTPTDDQLAAIILAMASECRSRNALAYVPVCGADNAATMAACVEVLRRGLVELSPEAMR